MVQNSLALTLRSGDHASSRIPATVSGPQSQNPLADLSDFNGPVICRNMRKSVSATTLKVGAMLTLSLLANGIAKGDEVVLAWDPSPTPTVTKYELLWGPESGNYTNSIILGNVTTGKITGLKKNVPYYFIVKAITGEGLKSDPSNELRHIILGDPNPIVPPNRPTGLLLRASMDPFRLNNGVAESLYPKAMALTRTNFSSQPARVNRMEMSILLEKPHNN